MAGLSSLTADTATQTTELPSWYQGAQQQAVDLARQGAAQTPTAENTVGQQAVNLLQGNNNPFTAASSPLQKIANSAATPFVQDAQGQWVPNEQSTQGQLYNAQLNQLNQILPQTDAASTASAIGSGNFGSLRGLTAQQQARGNAFNTLASNQLQNALTSQTQGIQAGTALSNVGAQNIDQALKTGQWQQVSPFGSASAFGKVLGGLGNVGSTQTNTAATSPLKTAGVLGSLLTDSPLARTAIGAALGKDVSNASTSDVLKQIYNGTLGKLTGAIPGGSGGYTPPTPGYGGALTYDLGNGASLVMQKDGTQTIFGSDGRVTNYDQGGNPIEPAPGYENNFNTGTIQDQQEAENAANGYDDLGYAPQDYGYAPDDYSYSEE